MDDRDEILEVLARYARALEERDGKAVAALFAADGEFTLFGRYGSEQIVHRLHPNVAQHGLAVCL